MKKISLLLLIIGIAGTLMAQNADSLKPVAQNIEFLYQRLIEQTEDQLHEDLTLYGDEASFEDLMADYLYYLENPININSEEAAILEEIRLLDAFQIESLQNYKKWYGDLIIPDELLMVEGFSETVVRVISPLVYFGKSERNKVYEEVTLGKALTRGRYQVAFNYAEKWGAPVNEDFLGSPRKLQLKYTYHYKQQLKYGVVVEKDAGEPKLFDFVGAHVYARDMALKGNFAVRDVALGDYLLSFGQGLTLWTGTSFGKNSGSSSPMKRAAGVRPKASANEGQFFRGAATTLRYHDFYASLFYSNRKIDATVSPSDTLDEPELASALQETGYHRTPNELAKRHAIRQQVLGGHLCYAGPNLEIGYTLYHLRLSVPLDPKPSHYNQFYFHSDCLTDMGLDFRWLLGNTAVFGELARSDNGAFAGLVGMTMKPKGYIDFSVLYRNYDKSYQSLFNGAFGESSRGQGEEGLYLGVHGTLIPTWELLAYCDFFRMTWLNSQVYSPSWGQEYSLKIDHQINKNAALQLRFKSKTKMKNSADDHTFSYYPVFYTKRSVNVQISYGITEALTFSDKAAYAHYLNDDGTHSRGYLLCHDISFKPPDKPYSLAFRCALFDSDDYYSRITIYENDVLGAFSIPSLYGRGCRAYLVGQVKLINALSLYAKVGCTVQEKDVQTDLKLEIIWKN